MYSDDADQFCGNTPDYDMKLFFHAIYDQREFYIRNKKIKRFLEKWLDESFEDAEEGWHSSYNVRKRGDKKAFSTTNCIKKVMAFARKHNYK